jgi:hypothetical protein
METNTTTYECVICRGINSLARLHCKHCGTIPRDYSPIGKTSIQKDESLFIEILSAFGCERQEIYKIGRLGFQRVADDYYAESR